MRIIFSLLLLLLSSINLARAITCTINSRRLQSGNLENCAYGGGTTGCAGTNDVVLVDVTIPGGSFASNTGKNYYLYLLVCVFINVLYKLGGAAVRCDNIDPGFDGSDTFFGSDGLVSKLLTL